MPLRAVVAICVVAATLTVFGQVCGHVFVSLDDSVNVYENPMLDQPSLQKTAQFWTQPYVALYIPVTYTAWSAIAAVAGRHERPGSGPRMRPGPFHAANLLIHAGASLLVLAILRVLLMAWLPSRTGKGPPGLDQAAGAARLESAAGLGALLFALHPLQAEPVAWVTGMRDLLSALLALASIHQFLLFAMPRHELGDRGKGPYRASPVPGPPARSAGQGGQGRSCGRRWPPYCLALRGLARSWLLFALALLSKPTAVVAPVMAAGLAWLASRARIPLLPPPAFSPALHWLPWAGFALVGVPLVALNKALQSDAGMEFVTPAPMRPLVAADALGFYAAKLFWPLTLSADYGRTPQRVLETAGSIWPWLGPLVVLAIVLAAAVGFVVGVRACRWPAAHCCAGVLLFVLGLSPVLGLLPFDFQTFSTVADRYAYLAMLGPAVALAGVAAATRRHLARWGIALLLSALAFRTGTQTAVWRDSVSVFSHALRFNPRSYWMQNNLGFALADQGKLEEAIVHYEEALRLKPAAGDVLVNLGVALAKQDRLAEAIVRFRRAAELNPDDSEAHQNLGLALGKTGDGSGALRHFETAVRLKPQSAGTRDAFGIALARVGRLAEAAEQFAAAVELAPGNPEYFAHLQRARQQGQAGP